MILSKPQQQRFWREWGAIKTNFRRAGWTDAQIENERHALLERAGFESLTQVDKVAGFDKVLAELGALRDNLPRTQEIADPTIGEARRLRHVIRTELLPCLALYMSEPFAPTYRPNLVATGLPAAEAYLQTIITDLVRWEKTDRPIRPPTLEDLDARPIVAVSGRGHTLKEGPSQLAQAMMTINARLHTKRNEHRHTIHQMKTLAGIPCDCRQCLRGPVRKPAQLPPAATVLPPVQEPVESNCPF